MLNTRLRKQIEWHFYNYSADQKLYEEKVRDICESGLTANLKAAGGHSGISRPTENKAIRLEALGQERSWAGVVQNTFNTFRFEPEYYIMVELYIKRRPYRELFKDGIWETTFYRWRDKWLQCAYKWAREFGLL